ncbi:MAG: methyltransferase domain-containing protein [Saprospiraceae bacterium]|nr:methyltransferase domain-containing protein [Saprospiraceae bacterium]
MSVKYDFNPDKKHPLFIIRNGLYNAVIRHRHHLTGKMMDFGCGSKPYQSLFSHVSDYIGVDYIGEGHIHDNEQIDVYYDGDKLPFEDDSFDSIFSSEVFEHLFNIDAILSELYRIMKSGGKILITCPFVWNEHEIPIDYARYTQFALKQLFEKHGFRIVVLDKSGNYITTVAQMIVLYMLTVRGMSRFVRVVNWTAIFLEKRLPIRNDLYLSNIVVAQKI